jgi:hypothetical protein
MGPGTLEHGLLLHSDTRQVVESVSSRGRRAVLNGNLLCTLQRVRDGVVQEMSSPTVQYAGGKDYARNTNFNCMATSGVSRLTVHGHF